MLTAKSLVVFSAINMNHKLLVKETDAVGSHADPHGAFQRTPTRETAPTLEFSPTFLTSSHTVYSVKELNCSLLPTCSFSVSQAHTTSSPHPLPPATVIYFVGLECFCFSKWSEEVTVPLDGTAVLCECGSTGRSLHFHTYWDLPTRPRASRWDTAKICGNKAAGERIRLTDVL